MIKSMTGYGRAQEIVDGREITVEIRSVNHRFFEFSSFVLSDVTSVCSGASGSISCSVAEYPSFSIM